MTAELECRELGRRIDDQWLRIGHPEMRWAEMAAKEDYDYLYLEKYDYDRDEPGPEDEPIDTSIAVFEEGLPYWRPLFTQNIFEQ